MGSPLVDTWLYATMLIENEWGERGTGFLVRRSINITGNSKIFLVTNKHVLNKNSDYRQRAS
jgi:hypothetical protein